MLNNYTTVVQVYRNVIVFANTRKQKDWNRSSIVTVTSVWNKYGNMESP